MKAILPEGLKGGPQPLTADEPKTEYSARQLDPIVAGILAQETIEVQRAAVAILTLLKSIARSRE